MKLNRSQKITAGIAATVIIFGGTAGIAVTDAQPASAATTCAQAAAKPNEAGMCANAWSRANLSPMSNYGVIQAGYEYCNIKKLRGSSTAFSSMASHYGISKGNAMSNAADAWLC